MAYEVERLHVESAPIAVVRRRAHPSELSTVVPQACGEVWAYLRAAGITGAGRHIALYLGDNNVAIGAEIAKRFESDGDVYCSSTPAGLAATTFHIGAYGGLHLAHDAIQRWRAETGHTFAGPSWEIYGHWTDDITKLRTDIYYLLSE